MSQGQRHIFENEQQPEETLDEKENVSAREKSAPQNGYELVMAILGWVEENWIFIFITLLILSRLLAHLAGK